MVLQRSVLNDRTLSLVGLRPISGWPKQVLSWNHQQTAGKREQGECVMYWKRTARRGEELQLGIRKGQWRQYTYSLHILLTACKIIEEVSWVRRRAYSVTKLLAEGRRTGVSFLLLQLLKEWLSRNFMDTMPLEKLSTPSFLFPKISNNNVAHARTSDVGVALGPLTFN